MAICTQVTSVSRYVPERIVTNDELSQLMNTSDQWIQERTGIKARRFVPEGTTTSDIAKIAIEDVLQKAGKSKDDIEYLIAATLSPDVYFPGIGTMLQHSLALKNVPAFDIRAQCSGFVYGLSMADAVIRSGQAKCLLLACSEVQSPVLEFNDNGRDIAVLFGDGAGALLIEAVECEELPSCQNTQRGVIDSLLGSDGAGVESLCLQAPGTATPGFMEASTYEKGTWHPTMDGRQVFKNAVHRMTEVALTICERNNISPNDIDLLLPHQANLRINEAIRDKVGLKESQVFNTIQNYGNTTSATIPIGMAEAEQAGKLKEGDLLLTLAFGAGYTWGANLLRW